MTEGTVTLTGPAHRALQYDLPEPVAGAAYTLITERLPLNPRRLGSELSGPCVGTRSAHPGTYGVVSRIDDDSHTVYVLSARLRGDVYAVR